VLDEQCSEFLGTLVGSVLKEAAASQESSGSGSGSSGSGVDGSGSGDVEAPASVASEAQTLASELTLRYLTRTLPQLPDARLIDTWLRHGVDLVRRAPGAAQMVLADAVAPPEPWLYLREHLLWHRAAPVRKAAAELLWEAVAREVSGGSGIGSDAATAPALEAGPALSSRPPVDRALRVLLLLVGDAGQCAPHMEELGQLLVHFMDHPQLSTPLHHHRLTALVARVCAGSCPPSIPAAAAAATLLPPRPRATSDKARARGDRSSAAGGGSGGGGSSSSSGIPSAREAAASGIGEGCAPSLLDDPRAGPLHVRPWLRLAVECARRCPDDQVADLAWLLGTTALQHRLPAAVCCELPQSRAAEDCLSLLAQLVGVTAARSAQRGDEECVAAVRGAFLGLVRGCMACTLYKGVGTVVRFALGVAARWDGAAREAVAAELLGALRAGCRFYLDTLAGLEALLRAAQAAAGDEGEVDARDAVIKALRAADWINDWFDANRRAPAPGRRGGSAAQGWQQRELARAVGISSSRERQAGGAEGTQRRYRRVRRAWHALVDGAAMPELGFDGEGDPAALIGSLVSVDAGLRELEGLVVGYEAETGRHRLETRATGSSTWLKLAPGRWQLLMTPMEVAVAAADEAEDEEEAEEEDDAGVAAGAMQRLWGSAAGDSLAPRTASSTAEGSAVGGGRASMGAAEEEEEEEVDDQVGEIAPDLAMGLLGGVGDDGY